MIPNIFISSTIADLRYLRDGLRDTVDDLGYSPVMSEYGEVGYINPLSAAESCYRSVKNCQMMVLILGMRYGSTGNDGVSVTHREYLTAKEMRLPLITFVEPQVLSYLDVYDSDPKAILWETFSRMDQPRKTFGMLKEISSSDSYNAILPFNSVADAKRKLKSQIAHFVGDRLFDAVAPINREVRDILAEVKTIRNQLMHGSATAKSSKSSESKFKKFYTVTRFLLTEAASDYRELLDAVFEDLDAVIETVGDCKNLEEVLTKANADVGVADSQNDIGWYSKDRPQEQILRAVVINEDEAWYLYEDRHLAITEKLYKRFGKLQVTLHKKARVG